MSMYGSPIWLYEKDADGEYAMGHMNQYVSAQLVRMRKDKLVGIATEMTWSSLGIVQTVVVGVNSTVDMRRVKKWIK